MKTKMEGFSFQSTDQSQTDFLDAHKMNDQNNETHKIKLTE